MTVLSEVQSMALDERFSGRVLVLGTKALGPGPMIDLVRLMRQTGRPTSVTVMYPDAGGAFGELEDVEVLTDELEDSLRPPVVEYDYAVVAVTLDYSDLATYAGEVMPLEHALVGRGWVPTTGHVHSFGRDRAEEELRVYLHEVIRQCEEDRKILEHRALQASKNEVRQLTQRFFLRAYHEAGRHLEASGRVPWERFRYWIPAYARLAVRPFGFDVFDCWTQVA